MAEKTTAGTSKDAGHAKLFPPLDPATFAPQLIWLAISFGLLYLILKKVALPRIGEVIEERGDRVRRDLEQAEKLQADTQKALSNYELALAEARSKAGLIAKDVRDTLNAEVEKERVKVEEQIARQLADAEQRIDATKAKAMASVGDIAGDVAAAIVARLTGKEVSQDEVRKAMAARAAE